MTVKRNAAGTQVSGVILAGGKSLRMGTRKALQRLGGQCVIEHVITRIAGLVDELYLVVDDVDSFACLGFPMVADVEPDKGPLVGLYTGIISSQMPWVLAIACDTPFVKPRLIETILARPRDTLIIATEINAQLQPLPALYSAQCGEVARVLLALGRRALRDLLAAVEVSRIPEAEVRQIDPELHSFFDLDTPDDLRRARDLIASGP